MRNEKIILLSAGRNATVRELRLKDVRRLVSEAKTLTSLSLSALNLTELFGDQFDRLLAIAGEFITMPDGESVDDLSISEAEEVQEAVKEVNTSFLAIWEKLAPDIDLIPASKIPLNASETSTEQPVA